MKLLRGSERFRQAPPSCFMVRSPVFEPSMERNKAAASCAQPRTAGEGRGLQRRLSPRCTRAFAVPGNVIKGRQGYNGFQRCNEEDPPRLHEVIARQLPHVMAIQLSKGSLSTKTRSDEQPAPLSFHIGLSMSLGVTCQHHATQLTTT